MAPITARRSTCAGPGCCVTYSRPPGREERTPRFTRWSVPRDGTPHDHLSTAPRAVTEMCSGGRPDRIAGSGTVIQPLALRGRDGGCRTGSQDRVRSSSRWPSGVGTAGVGPGRRIGYGHPAAGPPGSGRRVSDRVAGSGTVIQPLALRGRDGGCRTGSQDRVRSSSASPEGQAKGLASGTAQADGTRKPPGRLDREPQNG